MSNEQSNNQSGITEAVLRRAVRRLSMLKYFPSANQEAIEEIASMISEFYQTDKEVETATTNILRNPQLSEWPGAGAFFEALQYAVYPRGMWERGGKWIPSPENGRRFDITYPDGRRHWVGGSYFPSPTDPSIWDEYPPEDGPSEKAA